MSMHITMSVEPRTFKSHVNIDKLGELIPEDPLCFVPSFYAQDERTHMRPSTLGKQSSYQNRQQQEKREEEYAL